MKRYKYLQLLVFALTGFYFGNSCQAQIIKIKNGDLKSKKTIQHAQVGTPNYWKVAREHRHLLRVWRGPEESWDSLAIGGGAIVRQSVELPVLTDQQKSISKWNLMVAVDTLGKFAADDEPAVMELALINPANNRPVTMGRYSINNQAAVAQKALWKYKASSEEKSQNTGIANAFDGNPQTIWHSQYSRNAAKLPQYLQVDFGRERMLTGISYLPRQSGSTNGTIRDFEILISSDGMKWTSIHQGRFDYQQDLRKKLDVKFNESKTRHIRFLMKSETNGQAFASCAELDFQFSQTDSALQESSTTQRNRHFLPVAFDKLEDIKAIDLAMHVKSMRYAVVDQVQMFLLPATPSTKFYGKANGHLGPDGLGAGCYGFQGLMVHRQPALPVIAVTKGSPAELAGLRAGDTVLAVNRTWLPPGDISPGWNWLNNSHESVLGNAALEACKGRGAQKIVEFHVWRNGGFKNLKIELKLPGEIADTDFLFSRNKNNLLRQQLIQNIVKHQAKDGSWNRDPKRTALGGLALLATQDKRHARRIKNAANWLLANRSNPGTDFFWHPAYAGIFLSEYYLATGDQRVLPWIQRNLNHVESCFHTSAWGTHALGHGPRGLPYGNKALVAPLVHVLVFESLAKRCGVESQIWEISEKYVESAWSDPAQNGHGGLGYNASYKDQAEFWSRTGLLALALHLRNARPDMQGPLINMMHQRHPWLRNSHAYGEPGGGLGLICMSTVAPEKFAEVLEQYQWWFALAWQNNYGLKYTTPHMGAPYMESDSLINNLYAIVLLAQDKTLHITGGQDKNWLDVSNIPVPISAVQIFQDDKNRIHLRTVIPGADIRYTTDGSEPTGQSRVYDGPFNVGDAKVIKAHSFNKKNVGKTVTKRVSISKESWRVTRATGKSDQQLAIKHANRAIDGDTHIPWITEAGQNASTFPHEIMIDLGAEQSISQIELDFPIKIGAASAIEIHSSSNGMKPGQSIGNIKLDQFQRKVIIDCKGKKARYLIIKFAKPFQEGQKLLMLGEINVFR